VFFLCVQALSPRRDIVTLLTVKTPAESDSRQPDNITVIFLLFSMLILVAVLSSALVQFSFPLAMRHKEVKIYPEAEFFCDIFRFYLSNFSVFSSFSSLID